MARGEGMGGLPQPPWCGAAPGGAALCSAARCLSGLTPASLLPLGVVNGHVVVEHDEQEERHAQHVGEDGELHVRHHRDAAPFPPPPSPSPKWRRAEPPAASE